MIKIVKRKLTSFMYRVRQVRRRRYLMWLYHAQRVAYYANSVRKDVKSDLLVSIVVPCYNPPITYFEELLSSVFAQSYTKWELVLADGSSDPQIKAYLAAKSKSDTRIVYVPVENIGIADTTNKGIAASTGDLIAFLDHDDTLDPDALAYSVEAFERNEKLGLVYSDEDKLTEDGSRYTLPHYKPDFSLDLLRNVNYITHFVVVRAELVQQVGGIQTGYEGAQDYDFLLRIFDTGARIAHIPRILYHWRISGSSTAASFKNKKHITDAGVLALTDHYERNNVAVLDVRAIKGKPGFYRAEFDLAKGKRAILIHLDPSLPGTVKTFVKSCYERHPSIIAAGVEVLVCEDLGSIDVSHYTSVMIVQDTVIPGGDKSQVAQLFAVAEETGVGAVSPKLVADGNIIDMGIVESGGTRYNLFSGMEHGDVNFFGSLDWVRNVNALSGKVVVMPTDTFKKYQGNTPGVIEVTSRVGRLVVWAHVEMLALAHSLDNNFQSSNEPEYYNHGLTVSYNPIFKSGIDVVAVMNEPARAVLKKYGESEDDDE